MPDTETIVSASPTQVDAQPQVNNEPQVDVASFVRQNMENYGLAPKTEPTAQADATVVADTPAATPVLIPLDSFKEFGYENQETLINDLREYKTLKSNPPQPEQIKFENPESEAFYKAFLKGDRNEIHKMLSEQIELERLATAEIDSKTADEIIKAGLRTKYKDLTPAEIDYTFRKQYGMPPEPTYNPNIETEDEFNVRKSQWEEAVKDKEMDKIIEAKKLRPEIAAAKANLKLPEIQNQVDANYQQYLELEKLGQQIEQEDKVAYGTFTPQSLKTNYQFIDEANGVKVDFEYIPDDESFKQAVAMASNIDLFFQHFKGQDGKPDRQRFLKGIHSMLNEEKRILEAIKQAKNATIIAKLPDNTQGGLNRQMVNAGAEPSDLDKLMQQATGAWNRNAPYRRVS